MTGNENLVGGVYCGRIFSNGGMTKFWLMGVLPFSASGGMRESS